MFGKNQLSPVVRDDGSKLAVQEIFHTMQGEGPYSGVPAVFIRLAGCNLKCHFCDTEFESGLTHIMTVGEITSQVQKLAPMVRQRRLIVITGGEPLRQNIVPLINYLRGLTYLVQLETAGTIWLPGLERYLKSKFLTIVCSPKTGRLNPFILMNCQDWKYIVRVGENDPDDGLPVCDTQGAGQLVRLARPPSPKHTVWLSPCDEHDTKRTTLNVMWARDLCLKYGYRLTIQMHKIVGLP